MSEQSKGTGVVTSNQLAPHRNEAVLAFRRELAKKKIDDHRAKLATACFGDGWNAALDALRKSGVIVVGADPVEPATVSEW